MRITTAYLLSPRTSSSRRILYIIVKKISFMLALFYSLNTDAQCGGMANDATIFSDSGILPVELTSFTAEPKENNHVVLDWSTSSETNSNYFVVERSRDGRSYEKLTEVKAAGNALQPMYYRYSDNSPLQSISYYRLKQVDRNGAEKVYPSRPVYFTNRDGMSIATVPGGVYVTIKAEPGSSLELQIWNAQGQRVHYSTAAVEENETSVRINTSDFSPGIYLVKTSSGHSEFSGRFFVQRE